MHMRYLFLVFFSIGSLSLVAMDTDEFSRVLGQRNVPVESVASAVERITELEHEIKKPGISQARVNEIQGEIEQLKKNLVASPGEPFDGIDRIEVDSNTPLLSSSTNSHHIQEKTANLRAQSNELERKTRCCGLRRLFCCGQ